jgi:malic enzyme
VTYGSRTIHIGQANNSFIFPGVGLGVLLSEAKEVTDGMFGAAARRLAEEVGDEDLRAGRLFPPVAEIRRVEAAIAVAVIRQAREEGVGTRLADDDIPLCVRTAMWNPAYPRVAPA